VRAYQVGNCCDDGVEKKYQDLGKNFIPMKHFSLEDQGQSHGLETMGGNEGTLRGMVEWLETTFGICPWRRIDAASNNPHAMLLRISGTTAEETRVLFPGD